MIIEHKFNQQIRQEIENDLKVMLLLYDKIKVFYQEDKDYIVNEAFHTLGKERNIISETFQHDEMNEEKLEGARESLYKKYRITFKDGDFDDDALVYISSWLLPKLVKENSHKLNDLKTQYQEKIYHSPVRVTRLYDPFIDTFLIMGLNVLSYFREIELELFDSIYFNKTKIRTLVELAKVQFTLPSLSPISIKDVLKLRSHPDLPQFRSFLFQASERNVTKAQFLNEIYEDLLFCIDGLLPDRRGSLLHKIIENAPVPLAIPLPNPYGLYRGYEGFKTEKSIHKNVPWISFVRQLRKSVTNN